MKKKCKVLIDSLSYVKGFKWLFVPFLGFICLGIVLSNISPIVYGKMIDAIADKNIDKIHLFILSFGVISVAIIILSILETYCASIIGDKIVIAYQKKYYKKFLMTQMAYLSKHDLGIFISNLTSDIGVIVNYNIEIISTFIYLILNLVIPITLIFYINVNMAFVAMLILPIYIFSYYLFKNKVKEYYRRVKTLDDRYYSMLTSSVRGVLSYKAFQLENKMSNLFSNLMDASYVANKKRNKLNSIIDIVNGVTENIFSIILLFIASKLILGDSLSLGLLMSFNIYVSRLFTGVKTLQKINFDVQPVLVAMERLEDLQNAPVDDYGSVISSIDIRNTLVKMDKVYFSYDEQVVLQGLDLAIYEKGFYSIVGENGSGKTTIFKILMGLYKSDSGEVSIFAQNYNDLTTDYIRSHFTYIEKETFFIHDTIFENMRLYNEKSMGEVKEACRKVGLLDFIQQLPDKFETILEPDTLLFSSGMKQKFNFVRAILHPAPIMLFDEITSDLDGNSEKNLVNTLKDLGKNSVVISVSHRVHAVQNSDKIFVLDQGRIVDQGNWGYLIENCPLVKSLFQNV
ncbi:MAG: ABC transporter ATP-binding protein [Lachnospiraceae bacterium]|nr:ABC transporter ATP-binding protein [Lachnospiraceae bacterium]